MLFRYKDLFAPNQVVIARYVKRVNKLAGGADKAALRVAGQVQEQDAADAEARRSELIQESITRRRRTNLNFLRHITSGLFD